MTKVGEMGQILSGGQRSRISLARALYNRESSVVLIDGTLSSLDARVSKLCLDKGIKTLCKDKTVILVTYDLDQAQQMDYVMLMKDGGIEYLQTSQEFAQSLKETNQANQLNQLISKKDAEVDPLL
eukprot:CAMPEP_0116875756 /NCGR_PEP_ID=MMETSP0463-20121206/7826_1 /TAXON_ID=181622 /ORGANISM="Strombidinopsis sp, Strain SopsisLIS2011" /LENGTH=125 /DNA_ID=CAMNT_0004521935 /DNA_START=1797 /DNA_END=2174 /DNA_ORIENTATION=+